MSRAHARRIASRPIYLFRRVLRNRENRIEDRYVCMCFSSLRRDGKHRSSLRLPFTTPVYLLTFLKITLPEDRFMKCLQMAQGVNNMFAESVIGPQRVPVVNF